ncbi:MAG: TIGR01777 family oxidoreductase [Actinomycetota bacterium]|nr:TIGR01777 family oxidoreductase [Actinomycetota bacterium]
MNVLVSGASGLIGTALRQALTDRGDTVVRLVRRRTTGEGEVRWDPDAGTVDMDTLDRSGPIGAVVNLSGAGIGDHRWNSARRDEILHSRTAATATIAGLTTELDPPPSVFASGSAVGFYGNRGGDVVDEASPRGEGFLADVCAAWEEAASPVEDAGIRTVLLRSGIVLSTRGGALAKQLPLFRVGLGGRLGSGRQYMSWITLEDEVAAILHVLDDGGCAGPVNLTAPAPVTNAEMTRALGRALHRPAGLTVPSAALRLAFGGQMAEELLLGGQRVVPEALTRRDFAFRHPELDAALAAVLR